MKPTKRGIEAITVRRAKIADADKVRYRVYSSPSEFIAVIAENALLAVKAAGIKNPHKIVRDLPTEGIAVEAQRMATIEDTPERVKMPLAAGPDFSAFKAELKPDQPTAEERFVAMTPADLQRKGQPRARIVPPEMLHKIIEEHVRASVAAVPPVTAAPVVTAAPAPVMPPPAENPVDAILNAPPSEPTLQTISELADVVLPPASPTTAPAPNPNAEVLSESEVKKLLNE